MLNTRETQPTLIIVRGLPGAGKSTLAEEFGAPVREADKFPGLYTYRADGRVDFHGMSRIEGEPMIARAHAWCQGQVREDLSRLPAVAVVANTFVAGWEFTPYLEIAKASGARVVVVDVFDSGYTDEELADRNTHGVPEHVIARMRANWEADWRAADPRPPWERGE